MDRLYESMNTMLETTPMGLVRYLYNEISWESRMMGIIGPRGVGKTTMLLQRIKMSGDEKRSLYVSADNMYFAEHTLLELAAQFARTGGRHLFIDEVHKYPNWSRELKNIYDSHPDLQVCFTGSSMLDITKGESDLSRRAPLFKLQGLSYREYLSIFHGINCPVFTLDQVLSNEAKIPGVRHPLEHFSDYLRRGYYPFGTDVNHAIMLDQIISMTLEFDIPQFAGMSLSTGRKLKTLMAAISISAPFKPNMTKLGSQIGSSRNSIEDFLAYMESAGLIARLRNKGAFGALGKVEKVYLENTNILYNLADDGADTGSARETFFFNQASTVSRVMASPVADFEMGGKTFEVGGKGKTGAQISGMDNAYIVKDDIEVGHSSTVPLWSFGLMY